MSIQEIKIRIHRAAIEAAILQLVKEGETKGLWKFKDDKIKLHEGPNK